MDGSAPINKPPMTLHFDTHSVEFGPPCANRRRAMIELAAYLRAEQRGFAPGRELDDWLAAEAEVDRQLLEAAAKISQPH